MAARKSMLFLNSVLPVTKSHDDIVRQKFKPGKFVLTHSGFIKVAGNICLLASLVLTLSSSYCEGDEESIYRLLQWISTAITLIISFGLYLIFCFGVVVKKPATWVKIDIIFNLIFAIATIACSAITMEKCINPTSILKVPGPLGLAGGSVLIISCASLFLLYRFREEEDVVPKVKKQQQPISRKSLFV